MLQTVKNRSVLPLPVTVEEIDLDWLNAALRTRAPDATLKNFEIVDINNGTCTKIRLRLDMDEAGKQAGIPELVMLKGGFEPHSRRMHFMHEKEVRGYRDVMPVLKLRSPKCYFADYSEEQKQGIVIMDDLVYRGVTFCHPQKPQSFNEVARRLSALARFHAQTWDSPELAPGGRWSWTKEPLSLFRPILDTYFTPEIWRRFIEAPRGAAASVRFHDKAWMTGAFEKLLILYTRHPLCVLHGDTHLGNLYVDTDGEPGFFNSGPMRGPVMMEITYHITGALDPANRRRWERPLVQHYLEELRRNGVDVFDLDDAMRQFGTWLVLGYCIFLINESHYQPEAVNTAYTARFSAAMLDHDTIGKLEAIA